MFRKAKQNRIFQDVVDQIQIRTGVAGGSLSTEQVSESLALLIRYQKVPLAKMAEFREGVDGIVAALRQNHRDLEDLVAAI